MNNEMYLLVFSGSYLGHLAVTDEVKKQLEYVQDRFGIEEICEVESHLANLINQYLFSLTDVRSNNIEYSYTTIKVTYKDPVALAVNKDFDSCLRQVVLCSDDPCGVHFTYLIEEDGILSFHNTSAILGWNDTFATDEEGFYEEVVSPETLY